MNLFTELRIFNSQLTKNHPVIKEGVRWSERPVKLMAFETPFECSHWIRIYLSRATSKKKSDGSLLENFFFSSFLGGKPSKTEFLQARRLHSSQSYARNPKTFTVLFWTGNN